MQTKQLNDSPTKNPQPRPHFSLSAKGKQLAETSVNRRNLLTTLCENQCFGDAIMLLSHAMPHKAGIQWGIGCVCANNNKVMNSSVINAVESWASNPTEDNRAKLLPNNSLYQPSSATWIAMAIYWAGGSIGENETTEKVPDQLVNDSIFSSIMLSVQETKEEDREYAYNDVIASGIRFLYG